MSVQHEAARIAYAERIREAERRAALHRLALREAPMRAVDVLIRLCRRGDDPGLQRLAELEGRPLPSGPLVLAEQGGEIVAALPLESPGHVLADPFLPTADLVELLRRRAAQILAADNGRRQGFRLRALPWRGTAG